MLNFLMNNRFFNGRNIAPRLASGAFIAALVFASCTSVKAKPENVVVNYGDAVSVNYEIDRARKVLDEKDPVEALARAKILKEHIADSGPVNSLYIDAETKTLQSFDAAVSSGQWGEALRLFRSLDALSAAPAGWTLSEVERRRKEDWIKTGNDTLADLDKVREESDTNEPPSPVTVAHLMNGTVTVWVDRGIRVENGVGYADRVIGSGFFIDPRGYFVTNYHVIASEVDPTYEGYSRLYIKLQDGRDSRVPAKVIGWDPVMDLALVKTEITPESVFRLGSSGDLAVGARIYAMGSPAGLEKTLTSGIVSAQNRRFISLCDVLQIDAPINHGNSGGPIVDETGLVQAVVFAGIEQYEGLNFAIPVEYLKVILPSLYAGGKVNHPWLAASGRTVALPGSPDNAGVSLVYSMPDGPLERAGIPSGTIITAVNGRSVTTIEELQAELLRQSPLTIVRLTAMADPDAKAKDWFVLLADRPESPSSAILDRDLDYRAMLPVFGLDLSRIGNSKRYTVNAVTPGGIADESGFSPLDVVEIRELKADTEAGTVSVQLYTKRRKSGYLDAYIGLAASLDSPSYF